LQETLGGAPSCWAMYRFSRKLRENKPALAACLDACAVSLRAEHADFGRDVAIDASDLPAFANGQRYVSKGGRERERFSDPDASWGHRSAVSTRKGGGYYGYKLHLAVCTTTSMPLAWQVETARRQESNFVVPLLDAIRARGIQPETVAMDKGYDNTRVYGEVEARGCEPVIPLRGSEGESGCLAARARRSPVPAHPASLAAVPRSVPGPSRRGACVRRLEESLRTRSAPRSRPGTGRTSRRPHDVGTTLAGAQPSAGAFARGLAAERPRKRGRSRLNYGRRARPRSSGSQVELRGRAFESPRGHRFSGLLGFHEQTAGKEACVILAASTVAVVAIAVVIVVALVALIYIVPRGGRRRR
jgi:hypothetical protein